MALSCVATPRQSGHGSDGNDRVLTIQKKACITETSPIDCLVLYPAHWFLESYLSADMKLAYSAARTDWIKSIRRKILNFMPAELRLKSEVVPYPVCDGGFGFIHTQHLVKMNFSICFFKIRLFNNHICV